jgi:uncharacterized RDD family membrane protein YckC
LQQQQQQCSRDLYEVLIVFLWVVLLACAVFAVLFVLLSDFGGSGGLATVLVGLCLLLGLALGVGNPPSL